MSINWTKLWAGVDDGTILSGVDLRNIQQDLSTVLTTSDVGQLGVLVFYNNEAVSYDNEGVFI